MKIICPKSQFLHGVTIVSKAVSTKTTMDILECILIEAFDNCIKLTANDTELGIETTIEGDIVTPGKIALEAKLFSEIIKKIPDNDVILETEENGNTSIRCEQIHCNIMGKQGDDFSHLPVIEKENKITVSQYDLKEVIHDRRTVPDRSESADCHIFGRSPDFRKEDHAAGQLSEDGSDRSRQDFIRDQQDSSGRSQRQCKYVHHG